MYKQEQYPPRLYGVLLDPGIHQIYQISEQIREFAKIRLPFEKEIFIFSCYLTPKLPFFNKESMKSPEGERPRIDCSLRITNYIQRITKLHTTASWLIFASFYTLF